MYACLCMYRLGACLSVILLYGLVECDVNLSVFTVDCLVITDEVVLNIEISCTDNML